MVKLMTHAAEDSYIARWCQVISASYIYLWGQGTAAATISDYYPEN